MSVEITEDGSDVQSRFRIYRFRRGEVDSIDIIPVTSTGFGAVGVGFIPFVGSVSWQQLSRASEPTPATPFRTHSLPRSVGRSDDMRTIRRTR